MSTKRSQTELARAELGQAALNHLFMGSCLIAGGCSLCDQVQEAPDFFCCLRMDTARELWTERREELIEQWTRQLELHSQPGRYFPWFIELLFDDAVLPELDPRWPPEVQDRYRMIRSNLYELRCWIEENP